MGKTQLLDVINNEHKICIYWNFTELFGWGGGGGREGDVRRWYEVVTLTLKPLPHWIQGLMYLKLCSSLYSFLFYFLLIYTWLFLYTTLKLSLTFPQLLSAPSVQWIYGKRESFFRAAVSEPCARGVWCMRHGDPWVTLSVCFQFHISFPLPLSLCSKTICTYDTLLCVGCIHNVVLRKRKKKKKKNSLFCSVPERRAQVLAAPWGALTAREWGIVKLETLGIDGQAKKGNHEFAKAIRPPPAVLSPRGAPQRALGTPRSLCFVNGLDGRASPSSLGLSLTLASLFLSTPITLPQDGCRAPRPGGRPAQTPAGSVSISTCCL